MKKTLGIFVACLSVVMTGCGRQCDFRASILSYGNVRINLQLSENKRKVDWAIFSILEGPAMVNFDKAGNSIIKGESGSEVKVELTPGRQVWIDKDGHVENVATPLSAKELIELHALFDGLDIWEAPPVLTTWDEFRASVLNALRTGKLPGKTTFKDKQAKN